LGSKKARPGERAPHHRCTVLFSHQAIVDSYAGAEIPAVVALCVPHCGGDIGEVSAESQVAVDQGVFRIAAGFELSCAVNDSGSDGDATLVPYTSSQPP